MTKRIGYFICLMLLWGCGPTKNSKGDQAKVFDGPILSCGDAFVFQLYATKDAYLLVTLDMSQIQDENSQIRVNDASVKVMLVRFDGDVSNVPCNDVIDDPPKKLSEQVAKRGLVQVIISADEIEKKKKGQGYRISIKAADIGFDNGRLYHFEVNDVYVGWLPG